MIIELTSFNGEEFHLSETGWHALMQLARTQGVELPLDASASLSADEASQLAQSVTRGIARVAARGPHEDPALRAIFSSRSEGHWQEFIRFCRQGGFRVAHSSV